MTGQLPIIVDKLFIENIIESTIESIKKNVLIFSVDKSEYTYSKG